MGREATERRRERDEEGEGRGERGTRRERDEEGEGELQGRKVSNSIQQKTHKAINKDPWLEERRMRGKKGEG
jgi:hypothetical protein